MDRYRCRIFFMFMCRHGSASTAFLPVAFFTDTVLGCAMFVETTLIGFDDFYLTSPAGKIIAQVIALVFIVFSIGSYKIANSYYYNK